MARILGPMRKCEIYWQGNRSEEVARVWCYEPTDEAIYFGLLTWGCYWSLASHTSGFSASSFGVFPSPLK